MCLKTSYDENNKIDTLNKCLKENAKNNGFIKWNNSCNSCPCNYNFNFLSILKSCDIIFPAITNPNKDIIYSKWEIFQIK